MKHKIINIRRKVHKKTLSIIKIKIYYVYVRTMLNLYKYKIQYLRPTTDRGFTIF